MRWSDEWSEKEESMRATQRDLKEKTGKEIDIPFLRDKPELDEVHSLYLSEFYALSAGRTSNGFGVNPIQYSEIVAYLLLGMSIIPDDSSDFTDAIRLIDNLYLKIVSEKAKKDEKKVEKGAGSVPKRRSSPRPSPKSAGRAAPYVRG